MLAKTLLNNRLVFCAVLAFPSLIILWLDLFLNAPAGLLLFKTGIYSARLLILALAITPLAMLVREERKRWLLARRRYIGVAAFFYAFVHTVYFVSGVTLAQSMASFADFSLLTGWLSLIILSLMAITSNDFSMRRLGPKWKKLHRWGYLATSLALLHWMLVEYTLRDLLTYVLPLSLLVFHRFVFRRFARRGGGKQANG